MGREYPKCAGGKESHYDLSLWLSDNLAGKAGGVVSLQNALMRRFVLISKQGGDWGQRIYRVATIDQLKRDGDATIYLHEMVSTIPD
jgi:hypothetical protein